MVFFEPIPEATALVHVNGTYSENELYHHDYEIYAKRGNKFIKLHSNRETSVKNMYWKTLHVPHGVIGARHHRFLWLHNQPTKNPLKPVNNDPYY